MLKIHNHPQGTKIRIPIYNIVGKQGISSGFIPVLEDGHRSFVQTFTDENDILRTSKPLDYFGNKTCYHRRAIGHITTTNHDQISGEYMMSPEDRIYYNLDTALSALQTAIDRDYGKNFSHCAILRGSPLGYSVIDGPQTSYDLYSGGSSYLRELLDGRLSSVIIPMTEESVIAGFSVYYWCIFGIKRIGSFPCAITIYADSRGMPQIMVSIPCYRVGKDNKKSLYALEPLPQTGKLYFNRYCFNDYNESNPTLPLTSRYPSTSTLYAKKGLNVSQVRQNLDIMLNLYDAVLGDKDLWDAISSMLTSNESLVYDDVTYGLPSPCTLEITRPPLLVTREERKALNKAVSRFNTIISPSSPPIDWGILGNDCIDQIGVTDVNMVSYLLDLRKAGETFKDLYSFLRDIKSMNSRKVASTWLSTRYGDRLTVADTRRIFEDFKENILAEFSNKSSTVRTRRTTDLTDSFYTYYPIQSLVCTQVYKVYASPVDYIGIDRAVSTLMSLGLWLDTKNAWDLVPMSFVVDWFVNVGDFFESIDRNIKESYYNVLSVLRSCRYEAALDITPWKAKYPSLTKVNFIEYFREVRGKVDSAPFCMEVSGPSIMNVIDGTMLLLQR